MKKKSWSKKTIEELPKKHRLHLINSISGYKPANLIGSRSKEGVENLAIFSSVVHLGSDPALLGFILRPTTVPRDTFKNLLDSKFVTINHISESFFKQAHETSLSFPEAINEFNEVGLTPTYKNGFYAPFVAESVVSIGCQYVNHYPIEENGTILVVLSVEEIHCDKEVVEKDCFIRLDKGGVLTINGLDGYAKPQFIERIPYKRYQGNS